jgi:hypothetical protein
MTDADLELCLKCDHPKWEHEVGKGGCKHLTDLGPQEHRNPEAQICTCDRFMARKP